MIETYPYSRPTSIGVPEMGLPRAEPTPTVEQLRVVAERPPRFRKWLARVGIAGLATVSAATAEINIPELPGHQQAELSYQLATTDLTAAWHHAPWQHPPDVLASDQTLEPEMLNELKSNFVANNNLFLSSSNLVRFYATTWGSAMALDSENILAHIPGPSQNAAATSFENNLKAFNDNYWGPVIGNRQGYEAKIPAFTTMTFPKFMDDEEWGAIQDMQSNSAVGKAEQIFSLGVSQEDKAGCGVYWQVQTTADSKHSINVVSNAPFVMLGAELYRKTGKAYYLDNSISVYNCLNKILYNPKTDLYYDHINSNGSIDATTRTYVEGTAAGASAALGHINRAISDIKIDIPYFAKHHLYGNPAFDEIFFKNAFWIAGLYNNAAFTSEVKAAIDLAMKSEPDGPSDILDATGEIGESALSVMPTDQYINLFFGSVALGARPHNITYAISDLKKHQ